LTVVGILRGAFIFMADLVRSIPRDLACDFLSVRSYGDATVSSGEVQIAADLTAPIEGRHVLLVEDIVDTGLTLKYLLDVPDTFVVGYGLDAAQRYRQLPYVAALEQD
jgi:hypoxanthine phosphoribosyltransferase